MNPEIKSACERILLQRKSGCSFSHTPDAPAIARAYLDQCAEIERLKAVINHFSSWLDHWSMKQNQRPSQVYGAWDEAREVKSENSK